MLPFHDSHYWECYHLAAPSVRLEQTSEVICPHWDESKEQEKQVRVALYKSLRGSTNPKRMVEVVDGLMTMLKRAS